MFVDTSTIPWKAIRSFWLLRELHGRIYRRIGSARFAARPRKTSQPWICDRKPETDAYPPLRIPSLWALAKTLLIQPEFSLSKTTTLHYSLIVSTYRVHFTWKEKKVILEARSLDLTHPYFVSIKDLLFPKKTKLVINPSEDELRKEFSEADHLMIPFQAVSLIEEISDANSQGGSLRLFEDKDISRR